MQAQDKPLRPHGLYQLYFCLSRRLTRCFGWKGRNYDALGPQRRKTPLLARGRRYRQRTRVQPEQVLALRSDRKLRQDLRPREQVRLKPLSNPHSYFFSSPRSIVDELKPEIIISNKTARDPECVSLAWSADGQTLFGGFSDDVVRVWAVTS